MSNTALEFVKTDKKRPNATRKIMNLQKHPDPYVTTSDLAGYWRVSRRQIYKQIDAGTLTAIKLRPRLLRISTAEAIRFEHIGENVVDVGNVGFTPNGRSADEEAAGFDDLILYCYF